ncbi:MAG: hypothetical protein ACC619_02690 [Paracoccaceae bacterium]
MTTFLLAPLTVAAQQPANLAASTVAAFVAVADQLPCQQNIAAMLGDIGYRATAASQDDTDYADIEYAEISGPLLMTVAFERTPIGAQYSVTIDIAETDAGFADRIIAEMRAALSLAAPVSWENLARGSAQSWTVTLSGGEARIIVRQYEMKTQIIGILAPLRPGAAVNC